MLMYIQFCIVHGILAKSPYSKNIDNARSCICHIRGQYKLLRNIKYWEVKRYVLEININKLYRLLRGQVSRSQLQQKLV